MAIWKPENVLLTLKGNEALSKVLAGQGKLTVTRIVTGAGYVSPSTLYNQKNVSNIKQTLEVNRVVTDANGSEISTTLSNINLDTAYSLYQIGVYCKHTDSDEEFLYLIAQCETDKPDIIPAKTDTVASFSYNLYIQHEGTTQFEVTVNQSGVISISMLGKPNGVATLGSDGILTENQRPKADGLYMPDGSTKISAKIAEIESERLLALAAAAPYSASQTYAVGSYCTKNGKFYKANRGIHISEEWTDAHWTETTIGAELVYIDGHAANMNVHVTPEDKQRWDESIQIEHIDAALPFTKSVRLASGNGIFVALAPEGDEAAYSKNGAKWTKTKLPISASGHWAVCYGNGKFVAVEYGSNVAIYSEDGVTWTQTTMPASLNWKGITYGGGKFVAIAYSSANFAYSEDGVTWTLGTMPAQLKWHSITYGAGKFVTIANSSAAAAYSEDGVTWTRTDLPSNTAWYSVAYGNGKFFAVPSNNNSAAYSEDGVTWAKQVTPSNKQLAPTITFGGGKFVIIYQGTNWVLCSEECKVWNKYLLPEQNFWRDITFGNGRFVTCAFTNGDSPNTAVAISDNGIVWNDFIDVIQTVTGTDVTEKAKEIVGDSNKPISKSITLSASGWNSSKTQTVTVSGVLADETKQLITPTPALASQAAYYEAVVLCTGQSADKLTFTAKKIPTDDLTVYVTIQEVSA